MELTQSWQKVFPQEILYKYDFCETRNASAILKVTSPQACDDITNILKNFTLTIDKLTTPGGNKSVIAKEIDDSFRIKGWREARFDQNVITTLTIFRWTSNPEKEVGSERVVENSFGGHKVDNVLDRVALDVEWNSKDGNLDRDLANYTSLYDGGIIDVGIIITRTFKGLQELTKNLIQEVKSVTIPSDYHEWNQRISKLSHDPLGTATTSNFDKLIPKIKRGDGRGCPILGIGITERCYLQPELTITAEILRLATLHKHS